MEVRVEGESNSVTRLIRGRDSDGAQLYPPPGREPTWLILQPHTEGREEEVAGFFGGAFKDCARSKHKILATNITEVASKMFAQVKIFC